MKRLTSPNNAWHAACCAALLLVGFMAAGASGQVNPPSWWNTQDQNTISLSYQFDTNADPPVPNLQNVPNWYPAGGPTWTNMGSSWGAGPVGDPVPDHAGVQGLQPAGSGPLTAMLSIEVPNQFDPFKVKNVWVQYDWFTSGPNSAVGFQLTAPNATVMTMGTGSGTPLPNGWTRVTLEYVIKPQPAYETLKFTFSRGGSGGTAVIDNLHFGTQCVVPEPAGLVLFASGLIACAGLRPFPRRRKK